MYHAPAAASRDFTALDIGVSILSDTPSGRLYKALVGQGLSAGVFGFAAGLHQPGYAFFGAQLESGMDQAQALATLTETMGRSEERRVGKEFVRTSQFRWEPDT